MNETISRRAAAFDFTRRSRQAEIYPYYRSIEATDGTQVVVHGRAALMFGSNDYLGLSHHPQVKEAATLAIAKYGTGIGGSRLLNGSLDLHEQLEASLAAFVGKPDAVVFATGYQANVGALSALLRRHDIVLHDANNHASLIDGARLSFAKASKFAHNDAADLQRALVATLPGDASSLQLVAVESVYSMDGDVAPLAALAATCRDGHAALMIDEAHALGVIGPGGRGGAAAFSVTEDAALIMGTFSKSLASVGGFIATDCDTANFLKHHARALVFSAALSPANSASALAALRVLQAEPERVARLATNVRTARAALTAHGFALTPSAYEIPIIPIHLGSERDALTLATRLLDAGVFVNPVIPPAVAAGSALLRFSVMATHTRADIEHAVSVLASCYARIAERPWAAPAAAL